MFVLLRFMFKKKMFKLNFWGTITYFYKEIHEIFINKKKNRFITFSVMIIK